MLNKKYVQICFDEITRETEKAILVEGTWLPKSQLLVVLNNQYYDISTKTVKEHKEKSPYCLLCPLWLHMKSNMSFKKSFELDKWLSDLNIDKRTTIKYKMLIAMNYNAYKEGK